MRPLPRGYGIQRQLAAAGHDFIVVAPSLMLRKPGDRIKTDRRDAINLVGLHWAGALPAVWVLEAAPEAMHDLVRACLESAGAALQQVSQAHSWLRTSEQLG